MHFVYHPECNHLGGILLSRPWKEMSEGMKRCVAKVVRRLAVMSETYRNTGGALRESHEINHDAYNWWASGPGSGEVAVPLMLSLLDLGKKLKVKFDVSYDSGAYEQAWAVGQGLAEEPTLEVVPIEARTQGGDGQRK